MTPNRRIKVAQAYHYASSPLALRHYLADGEAVARLGKEDAGPEGEQVQRVFRYSMRGIMRVADAAANAR
jgi:hypothetical protein